MTSILGRSMLLLLPYAKNSYAARPTVPTHQHIPLLPPPPLLSLTSIVRKPNEIFSSCLPRFFQKKSDRKLQRYTGIGSLACSQRSVFREAIAHTPGAAAFHTHAYSLHNTHNFYLFFCGSLIEDELFIRRTFVSRRGCCPSFRQQHYYY